MQPLVFEEQVLQAVQQLSTAHLDIAMLAVTMLGNPVFWICAVFALLWWGKDRDAFFLMNVVVFSAAVVAFLKPVFGRFRPDPAKFRVLAGDTYSNFSFPSGHATLAGAAYSFLSREVPKLKWPLLATALLIAYSRMYLGAHFLLDVAAGLAVGYAIGLAAYEVKKRLEHSHLRITRLEEEAAAVIAVLAALAVFAFLEPPMLSAVVFGWYAGFFLLKEQGIEVHVLTLRKNLKMLAFGAASVFVFWMLSKAALLLGEEAEIAVLFLLGFWAGYAFPALYEYARTHRINLHAARKISAAPRKPKPLKPSAGGIAKGF